jgi:hypothetical protein
VLQDAGGQGESGAVAINTSGQSLGYSNTASGQDAVLWSPSGTATALQDAGGQGFSGAVAINASGKSVGFSLTASGQDAVLWSKSGTATVLQDVGGMGFDNAVAINASGESVGYSLTASGGDEAVLWSSSGTATDLGAVLGSAWSDTQAVALNNLGDIVGYGDYQGGQYGFLLTPVSAAARSAMRFSAAPVPEPSTWAMVIVGLMGLGFARCRRALAWRGANRGPLDFDR